MESNSYATFILKLVDLVFKESQINASWFDLVRKILQYINDGKDPEIMTDIIQIKLLTVLGLEIVWDKCIECGRSDLDLDFSDKYNGMLCLNHRELDHKRWRLIPKTVYLIDVLSKVDVDKIGDISVNETNRNKIWSLLESIYENKAGIKLKSHDFINDMRQWEK